MKQYKIKPEHYDYWGIADENDAVVDMTEIVRLAIEWDTTVAELIEQVEEI